jgi:hypothetical protein
MEKAQYWQCCDKYIDWSSSNESHSNGEWKLKTCSSTTGEQLSIGGIKSPSEVNQRPVSSTYLGVVEMMLQRMLAVGSYSKGPSSCTLRIAYIGRCGGGGESRAQTTTIGGIFRSKGWLICVESLNILCRSKLWTGFIMQLLWHELCFFISYPVVLYQLLNYVSW